MNYQGDAKQDVFVVNVLNKKKNGFFLEIGSAQPKDNNNTYVLEKDFDF